MLSSPKKLAAFLRLFILISAYSKASSCPGKFPADPTASTPFEATREWIRENLVFGFERTYSSPILNGLYEHNPNSFPLDIKDQVIEFSQLSTSASEQSTLLAALTSLKSRNAEPSSVSPEIAKEVLRFLKEVLGVNQATLHISSLPGKDRKPKNIKSLGFISHSQTFTFEVLSSSGRNLVVTLEPSCLEVNQAPGLQRDQNEIWAQIDEKSQNAGFVGTIHKGGHGGGGTDMHLSWKNPKQNLWVLHPALLARFLEFPLVNPSLVYLLNHGIDYGPLSNIPLPFESSVEDYLGYKDFIYHLTRLEVERTDPEKVRKWLHKNAPQVLLRHYSYISLKNFHEESLRAEIRFQRSSEGIADVQTLCDLWVEIIYHLLHHPINYNRSYQRVRESRFAEISPLKLEDGIPGLFKTLKLTPDLQNRLRHFANGDIFSDLRVSIKNQTDIPALRAALVPPADDLKKSLYLEISADAYPKGTKLILLSLPSAFEIKASSNRFTFYIENTIGTRQYHFVAIVDPKTLKVHDRFIVDLDLTHGETTLRLLNFDHAINDPDILKRIFLSPVHRFDEDLDWTFFPEVKALIPQATIENLGLPLNFVFRHSEYPDLVDNVELYINGYKVNYRFHADGYGTALGVDDLFEQIPFLTIPDTNVLRLPVIYYRKNPLDSEDMHAFWVVWDFNKSTVKFESLKEKSLSSSEKIFYEYYPNMPGTNSKVGRGLRKNLINFVNKTSFQNLYSHWRTSNH